MTHPALGDTAKTLTVSDVLVSSQQYDPALVYHVSLPRKAFALIHDGAFARCHALQMLDLCGSRLTTLDRLEPVAAQLTYLNVAENQLRDIHVLTACASLQYCYLEGNQLDSVEALEPLRRLSQLVELLLQRSVSIEEGGPAETVVVLDNPVCRQSDAYVNGFLKHMSHVRWIDGAPAFRRCQDLSWADKGGEAAHAAPTTNEALFNSTLAPLAALKTEMTTNVLEEVELNNLLAKAKKRCGAACAA